MVLRPEHLDLVDAAGTVVAELAYDDDASAIAESLATVFGSDAEIEEFTAPCCEGSHDDPVPDGLEATACDSLMAEVVGTLGVDMGGTPSVTSIRSPIYTDVCE
ncbi:MULTISPECIES: hypothetical protein [unclassified Agromyces]|uniref:hypothetical protein n=1 Tax=unclassified Agromyces TaxID=2639701 RepID=UPI0030148A0B